MDQDSNTFQEFKVEMKQKLNALLLDKIMDAKKNMAAKMVGEEAEQQSGDKEAYQKFLAKKLKSKGYDSIEDIPKDKKDDFFNEVEKEWKSDDEMEEECDSDEKHK